MTQEMATLAGGCFWCLEAVYDELRGISAVVSGYTGGHVENPTYQQVCGKGTGHAEAVRITFDPSIIRYEDLLNVFFTIHDPTQLNRQGNDVGPQYRSAIFYHDTQQKATAEAVIARITAEKLWGDQPVVTEVAPAETFYDAEDYHQSYYANNSMQPYCLVVVAPKVKKARKVFTEMLKA